MFGINRRHLTGLTSVAMLATVWHWLQQPGPAIRSSTA